MKNSPHRISLRNKERIKRQLSLVEAVIGGLYQEPNLIHYKSAVINSTVRNHRQPWVQ